MNSLLIDSLFEIMRVLMGTSEIKIKKMGGGGASHGLHIYIYIYHTLFSIMAVVNGVNSHVT